MMKYTVEMDGLSFDFNSPSYAKLAKEITGNYTVHSQYLRVIAVEIQTCDHTDVYHSKRNDGSPSLTPYWVCNTCKVHKLCNSSIMPEWTKL